MASKYEHGASKDRRREILDAALACFAENGPEGVTIADVRAKSLASTGSIYHHFGDKVGLVGGVREIILNTYAQDLAEHVAGFPSAKALVKGTVHHFFEWIRANPNRARFLLNMTGPSHNGARVDTPLSRLPHEPFEALAAEGELRPVSRDLLAPLVLGPSVALADKWAQDATLPIDRDSVNILAVAAWRALRPQAAGEKKPRRSDSQEKRKKRK
jgi:AcrR family transcriptional regulator